MSGRIIGYARVSTTDQHLEQQIDRLRAAGAVLVFPDLGESGSKTSRPEWDKCLAELHKGDTLLAVKLDRFGRSSLHLAQVFADLEKRGVAVKCLDQPIDTTTAVGKLIVGMLREIAEFERGLTIERVKDRAAFRAHSGIISKTRTYGWKYGADEPTVNEDEAAVIREIARRLLAGEPQAAVCDDLNARGIPSVRGGPWCYTSVRQVMTLGRAAGLVMYGGEAVSTFTDEPILDAATYARLMDMFNGRKHGRQWAGKYLLTGVLMCGCGTALKGRPDARGNREYWCPVKHTGELASIPRVSIKAEAAENLVAEWTVRILSDPSHAEQIAAQDAALAAERERVASLIAKDEKLFLDMKQRMASGAWELDEYELLTKGVRARIASLRAELATLAATDQLPAKPTRPGVRNYRDTLTSDEQASWDARGDLTFLFNEGKETDTDKEKAQRIGAQREAVDRALNGRHFVVGPGKARHFDPDRITVVA